MSPDEIGDLLQLAIRTTFEMSMPMLLAGLVVGVLVSLFQAATQIQEVTLVFIPKMLAVGGTMWLVGPWMFERLSILMNELTTRMGVIAGG